MANRPIFIPKSGNTSVRRWCEICKKVTEHVSPLANLPLHCKEPHPGDGTLCSACGKPLSPMGVVVAQGLGAKAFCRECSAYIRKR